MADTGPHTTNSRILIVVCVLIAIWLVLPLFIIVPISFSGENSFSFPPKTWTLARYASLANPVWISALVNSLTIAVVVAILSSVLGTLAAFGIVRSNSKLMALVRAMILSPQVVPIVVFGLGLYLVFLRWNLVGTFWGFVIAHTVLAVPFAVITVSAALQTLDRSLERASASLGAGPIATFRQITLPIIRPAVLSGAFLAFLSSFDEVVLALFIQSPSFYTLPVQLYRNMTDTIDPTVAAVATLQLSLVIAAVVIALILQSRSPNPNHS
jgi:putative spermidine/putrescine transport system permease protein